MVPPVKANVEPYSALGQSTRPHRRRLGPGHQTDTTDTSFSTKRNNSNSYTAALPTAPSRSTYVPAGRYCCCTESNLIRVLAVTRNQITERSGDRYLNLTDHELLLPPILAELLSQLPCPRPRSTLPEPEMSTGLLFPGRTPNRPVDAGMFANRLKQHGINPRGGRNTAFIRLASELPAAVLADLLAVDVTTATRWAKYAKRDWHTYLAERRIQADPSNSATPTYLRTLTGFGSTETLDCHIGRARRALRPADASWDRIYRLASQEVLPRTE